MTKLVHGIETAMEDDDEEIEAQLVYNCFFSLI